MALTLGGIADEFSISMITTGDLTITAGTCKVVVIGALGTRDEHDRFHWGRKVQLELYPEGNVPHTVEGSPIETVLTLPPNLMQDLRAFMVALEDYLQVLVDEENEPLPQSGMAALRAAYTGEDPRLDPAWRTDDGHNAQPGFTQPPRPRDRIPRVRGKKGPPT